MDFGLSDRVQALVDQVRDMVDTEIAPLDTEYHDEVGQHPSGNRFQLTDRQLAILSELKGKA